LDLVLVLAGAPGHGYPGSFTPSSTHSNVPKEGEHVPQGDQSTVTDTDIE
jgi:hypothetical protein